MMTDDDKLGSIELLVRMSFEEGEARRLMAVVRAAVTYAHTHDSISPCVRIRAVDEMEELLHSLERAKHDLRKEVWALLRGPSPATDGTRTSSQKSDSPGPT